MKARAHGDLSENAEYKYAKERQGFVSARLGQLKKRLGDIGMLQPEQYSARPRRLRLARLAARPGQDSEVEYKLVTWKKQTQRKD